MPLYLGLFDRSQFPSPPNPAIPPKRPSRKITDAGGMSVRTKVVRRTLSRFRPKAPKAIDCRQERRKPPRNIHDCVGVINAGNLRRRVPWRRTCEFRPVPGARFPRWRPPILSAGNAASCRWAPRRRACAASRCYSAGNAWLICTASASRNHWFDNF